MQLSDNVHIDHDQDDNVFCVAVGEDGVKVQFDLFQLLDAIDQGYSVKGPSEKLEVIRGSLSDLADLRLSQVCKRHLDDESEAATRFENQQAVNQHIYSSHNHAGEYL